MSLILSRCSSCRRSERDDVSRRGRVTEKQNGTNGNTFHTLRQSSQALKMRVVDPEAPPGEVRLAAQLRQQFQLLHGGAELNKKGFEGDSSGTLPPCPITEENTSLVLGSVPKLLLDLDPYVYLGVV
ncbi:hypothetical protein EYF80_038010 [Liparis tanakae]|uniref:Uncharacterized protein n=1 Tax=Liparis tanakae TaxID=230148 RepID=A0A4Z2GGI6_9TELE|nr:hypothetical protein EYF80_038010 [Liparis tanakae]